MSIFTFIPLIASVLAVAAAGGLYAWLRNQSPGNEKMVSISSAVREGAVAFIMREYKTIAPIGVVIGVLIALAIDVAVAVSFAVGATLSAIAGIVSIMTTVGAAPRAAEATKKGIGATLLASFRGGATAGLIITAMALLAVTLLYIIYPDPVAVAGAGFGASLVALFIRAGGGIYTKAADLGADLVGKIEAGIPEDDPRNPATIADNVGDNVGDAAGMGADVYESYVVTLLAAMLLGGILGVSELVILPLLVGGAGLIASIVGVFTVGGKNVSNPMTPLNTSFIVAAILAIILDLIITTTLIGNNMLAYALFASALLGVILVPIIQRITDYYTNYIYKPVKAVAEATKIGHSANILEGISQGLKSTLPLALSLIIAIVVSYYAVFSVSGDTLLGIYATAITTMAMLSLAGIVLSIDSFGPVSDNAGGIVEMSGMSEENRNVTDQLDAVGNTAKATTKGFAIASAALAALAMIQAFQHEAQKFFAERAFEYSLTNPVVIVGLLIGALLPFYISSRLITAVGNTAAKIVEEVRQQFKNNPGILEGTARPNYARVVDIATSGAIKELFAPAAIVVITPILVGVLLGPEAVVGVLTGAVLSGLYLAYHMANSGAAWDNAKKYLEVIGKKKTPEHAIAVSGDLVGDPYKDTAGPSLNTVIKVLNTVAIVFVSVFLGLLVL
ncbi:MAG: sodium-translocating pyrophosphatase [Aigarchaeota archaeon]|nr:sodium-translocating pyrophosphatase [Candidatus Pelearchaeum maunauluense]